MSNLTAATSKSPSGESSSTLEAEKRSRALHRSRSRLQLPIYFPAKAIGQTTLPNTSQPKRSDRRHYRYQIVSWSMHQLAADVKSDGGDVQITFRRIIVHPGGREEIEGVTPKQIPPPASHILPSQS